MLRLMIVAGEASGDKHGAKLVTALRAIHPELEWEFFGAGGNEMREVGVEILVDAREVAIMGALEVAMALTKFWRAFRKLRDAARLRHPHLIVLIDWPEFNLRLARHLKRNGHRIVYYISPQIWAWRSYRLHNIKRDIDRMLVILPFEQDYYLRAGVNVDYVGHPLLDSVNVTMTRDEFCTRYKLDPSRPMIALLPGSRYSEMKFILPPLLETVNDLNEKRPEFQFLLLLAPTFSCEELNRYRLPSSLRLITNDTYNGIAAADLAVVASGTATLETAIIGTPLIIVYRASLLNWLLFRPLINVPFIGLPNLIAGRQIVPELLQSELTCSRLSAEISVLLDNAERMKRVIEDLRAVREQIGEANASKRAAERLFELLAV